ncbi:MAG: TauD/TfdA family dioxygenase, partial [Planctomycetes bacterium]|nr:TauD/TfdA family dioxygenase [Planctomycetota bacterium]
PEPLPLTTVLPRVVPSGERATCFIDMERVLRELPEALHPFVDGRARHEAKWRYKIQPCDVDKSITEILEEFGALTPAVTHPTVITHPVHGRKLLYVSRGFTVALEEWPPDVSMKALGELFDFVEHEAHVHREPWRPGRMLLWDNRQLVHMAAGGSHREPAESHRVGVYDGLPFYADEPRGRLAS